MSSTEASATAMFCCGLTLWHSPGSRVITIGYLFALLYMHSQKNQKKTMEVNEVCNYI